jgi:hypothetical protein
MAKLFGRALILVLVALVVYPVAHALAVDLVRNGDFSNGLRNWHPGALSSGKLPGYPQWGTHIDPVKGDPSAFLDVPGGAFAYLDSDFFFMPDVGTLTVTVWGHRDPVVLGVQVKIEEGPVYVLDDIDPPKIDFGQNPTTKQYFLGTNVAHSNIAIRFVCRSEPSFIVGTFCDYDDVSITTRATTTTTSAPHVEYPVLHGKYVDVDWTRFRDYPNVALWAQATADAQYQYIAAAQGVPSVHMRRSLIHLDWGIGGWANRGEVGIGVDWFFGKNLATPPNSGPSAGMSREDYSLQRLDAELYHEVAHNIPVVGLEGYRPSWFYEALGTWAQSSVTQPGSYTTIRASLEDSWWSYADDNPYGNPEPFGGYGKGALFLWWLVENYGIAGLHRMVWQCFGWEQPWSNEGEIDARGFIPWTGMGRDDLAEDFKNSIESGWRADIRSLANKYAIPEFIPSIAFPVALILAAVIVRFVSARSNKRPGSCYQEVRVKTSACGLSLHSSVLRGIHSCILSNC